MSRRLGRNLRVRTASAMVMLPIVALALWVGGLAWAGIVAIVVVLATSEYHRLTTVSDVRAIRSVGPLLAAALVLAALQPGWPLYVGLIAGGAIITLLVLLIRAAERLVSTWLVALAGPILIGGSLSTLVLLRQLPDGLWWTFLPLSAVFTADAGAYLIGSAFGRRPILPRLSPGKTWAGTLTGFALCLVCILACVGVFQRLIPSGSVGQVAWSSAVFLGVVIGPLDLAGDVAVSALKRRAEVKDSSNLIPGHGGMLDRCDSLLITIPLTYLWAVLIM